MLEERVRLMFLSKDGTGIKQISLTWRKFCIFTSLFSILFIGVIALTIGVFTRIYHNYRIVNLENDREYLQKELLSIKERISSLSSQLAEVETSGDDLRSVADLPPIDDDTRQLGVGGPSFSYSLDYGVYTDEVNRTAKELVLDLDKLERAILVEKHSLSEIAAKLNQRQDWIDHFPSIRPILGGPITSNFGWRTDPFTKRLEQHNGIDITVRMGTPVLSTADGVVETARNSYLADQSWGKYVLIDHGPYKTLYAHLSKILVQPGTKVKKWQPIAEVGTTGKSEGPHLHYEVYENGKLKDPKFFIYN